MPSNINMRSIKIRPLAIVVTISFLVFWLVEDALFLVSLNQSNFLDEITPDVFTATNEFVDIVSNKSRDCLVVYHVPKCAGSSMARVMEQAAFYKNWSYVEWYNNRRPGPGPFVYSSTKIIHTGHLTPSFLQVKHTHHCYRMTLLREPVSRVISMYHYHHQTMLLSPNSTWDTIYAGEQCMYCPSYFDYMTRMFSITATWSMMHHKKAFQPSMDKSNLERAKSFLDSMDLVCFFPDFEVCLRKLHNAIQTEILPFPKANVGKVKQAIPVDVLKKIEAANEMDIELYEWARQKFNHSYTS